MNEEFAAIETPTEEEIEEAVRKHDELLKWALSLTEEQINYLCDGGWYNNAIRGYLIAAAKEAGQTREQINDLLSGLRWAMSEKDKAAAEKVYLGF